MLKQIAVNSLRPGMYLHELCGSWIESPFWRKSFVLTAEDLVRVQATGLRLAWIDISKGADVGDPVVPEPEEEPAGEETEAAADSAEDETVEPEALDADETAGIDEEDEDDEPSAAPEKEPPQAANPWKRNAPAFSRKTALRPSSVRPSSQPAPQPSTPEVQPRLSAQEERERARMICRRAKAAVIVMFDNARLGKAVTAEEALPIVQEISNSLMRNADALLGLVRMKDANSYTYMHSVAVCALMVALARQIGMSEEEVREAGMAGLLHDIGKMAIPVEVLDKPGVLSDEEFALVKTHPEEGQRILLQSPKLPDVVREVCLHHHEKIDGSGYPHGLAGENISLIARMGAICDVYDAVTSTRAYKKGWCPAESVHRMAQWKGHFDEQLFQAFVKRIGIYPVGTLVRLKSQRLGVVLEQTEKSLLTPMVKVFFSTRSMRYITPEVLNLGARPANDEIVCAEDVVRWGMQDIVTA